jgi:heat shock protein beta
LIGQFGVGFYSVYLISDKVTVVSKSAKDDQYIWQSKADRTFTVAPDPRGNTLDQGTAVVLHLKEDAAEFLEEANLEKLIARYSQFINYPISLWSTNTVTKDVPAEEEPKATDEDLEVSEEEDESSDKPKTKTVTETVHEWKRINTAKAIWTRNPKDIKEEEYNEFYKSLTKDTNGYLTKIHFTAEGEIAFRSILYVPKQAEWNLYDKFYEKSTSLKLYVRKVLISDEFDDFLPKYMNFIKGVVDSDDLPLNVSRETLAQSKVLRVMAKKITRKVLEMLTKLAEGKSEDSEEDAAEDEVTIADRSGDYEAFWKQYGKSLKLGVIDDRANRPKLAKLLRYVTSKSDGKLVSLDQYVEGMKEDQKLIYYITGENLESVQNSPMLERLKKLDLEVLYMVDPLDEYVVGSVTEYEGNPLQSVTKKDLKLPGVDDNIEELQKEYSALCDYLQKVYGKKVEKVEVGTRITSSPAVLVTAQYGWSANMERIMRAQTFADADKYSHMASKKIMEINPHHSVIKELRSKVDSGADEKGLEDLAHLMYDAALVNSGFQITDSAEFAKRITRVVSLGLGVDPPTESETSSTPSASKGRDEL